MKHSRLYPGYRLNAVLLVITCAFVDRALGLGLGSSLSFPLPSNRMAASASRPKGHARPSSSLSPNKSGVLRYLAAQVRQEGEGEPINLSVSPTSVNFGSVYANAESPIAVLTVTSILTESTPITYSTSQFLSENGDSINANSIAVTATAGEVSADAPVDFTINMTVPKDAKRGEYTGAIAVVAFGVRLVVRLSVQVILDVDPPFVTILKPTEGTALLNPTLDMFAAFMEDIGTGDDLPSGIDASTIKVKIDGKLAHPLFDSETGELSLITDEDVSASTETPQPEVTGPLGPRDHSGSLEVLDKAGNTTRKTFSYRIFEPPVLFARGIDLISIPFQLSMPASDNPFDDPGLQAAWWSPERNSYINFGEPGFQGFDPAHAFWVKSDTSLGIAWTGTGPASNSPISLSLGVGWNLIPDPFLDPVTWSLSDIKVRRAGVEKTLAEAKQAGWVEDFAWGWRKSATNPLGGSYFLVHDPSLLPTATGFLRPWNGYWMSAFENCELVIPPPTGSAAPPVSVRAKSRSSEWLATLQAEMGATRDSVTFGGGVSSLRGPRGLKIGKPPAAPGQGPFSLFIPGDRPSQALSVDVHQGLTTNDSWPLVLAGVQPNSKVALRWQDLGKAPRSLRFYLVDEITGMRRYMRTTDSYLFTSGATGDDRRFRIEVETGGSQAPLISSLVTASGGRSGVRHLSLVLSRRASITARVLTPSGRTVALVSNGEPGLQGLNTLWWNGLNADGQAVPRGLYLVEVVATTEEGQTARAVRSLNLR